ncbi:MAG: PD40 domain-containing protein, partial [Leptospiraceae bacterium]|nr:PD40 domain-containing protein [Leptospiraceae bacterium]
GTFTINSDGFEGMASLVYRTDEENRLRPVEIYFTSYKDDQSKRDGYEGLNIYFSRYRDSRWSRPEHLNIINSDFDDRMPHVSHDGQYMYFVSNRPGGYGGNDIWMSQRDLTTGQWSAPVNGGAVWNTRYNEIAPTLSPDQRTLFFSSDRPGGLGHYDFYLSRWNGYVWQAARNLGEPFNSSRDEEYVSMTHDGLWIYFASDRRELDARGEFDLYRVGVPEWLRSPYEILFTGQVLDSTTRRPLGIDATIKVFFERQVLVTTSRVFRKDPESTAFNNFAVKLETGREYRVQFSAPGYHPVELRLNYTGNVSADKIDRRIIYMRPVIETGPEEEVQKRVITGRVVDAETNLLLRSSSVVLLPAEGGVEPVTVTEGRFDVAIERGTRFTLRATAEGYEPAQQVFTEGPDLTEIVLKLRRQGGNDNVETGTEEP